MFPKLPLQKLQTALTVYKTADETASFLLREQQVDTVCGTDGNKIIPKPSQFFSLILKHLFVRKGLKITSVKARHVQKIYKCIILCLNLKFCLNNLT